MRALDALPNDERSASIRVGYELVVQTQVWANGLVGNGLNCSNCHLDAGRRVGAASCIGLCRVYPEYRARNGKLNSLEDRLDDCFMRSMNGTPLPVGSRERKALIDYIPWLSEGVSREQALVSRGFIPMRVTRAPQPPRGAQVYETRCRGCHGVEGEGSSLAPSLWGPQSYNIGEGMARNNLAASFIRHSMPPGQEGTLTDEGAYDVAANVNRQPRPDVPAKRFDWPRGGKPEDAPY